MSQRLISVKKIGCALALLVAAACSSGAHQSSSSTSPSASNSGVTVSSTMVPRPPVSAHIELPSPSMVAGSVETGYLVIENNTGAAVCWTPTGIGGCKPGRTSGCTPAWGVVLANHKLRQTVVFALACIAEALALRAGETKLPFTVYATYSSCSSTGKAQGPLTPVCLPGPQGLTVAPALPPDLYYATFFSENAHFTPVASVPVRVVSHP